MALCANDLDSHRVTHCKLTFFWVNNMMCHTWIENKPCQWTFFGVENHSCHSFPSQVLQSFKWLLLSHFLYSHAISVRGCLKIWPIRHTELANKVCVNRIGSTLFSWTNEGPSSLANLTLSLEASFRRESLRTERPSFKKTTTDGNTFLATLWGCLKSHIGNGNSNLGQEWLNLNIWLRHLWWPYYQENVQKLSFYSLKSLQVEYKPKKLSRHSWEAYPSNRL